MAKQITKRQLVVKFGLPKAVKVAIWVGASAFITATLSYLAANLASLHLDPAQEALILIVVNSVLAGIKEVRDQVK